MLCQLCPAGNVKYGSSSGELSGLHNILRIVDRVKSIPVNSSSDRKSANENISMTRQTSIEMPPVCTDKKSFRQCVIKINSEVQQGTIFLEFHMIGKLLNQEYSPSANVEQMFLFEGVFLFFAWIKTFSLVLNVR